MEKTVIGGLLIDQTRIEKDLPTLTPDDFTVQEYKQTITAMKTLLENGSPVDYVLTIEELEKQNPGNKQYAEVLGAAMNSVPSTANFDWYKEQLKEKRRDRDYHKGLEFFTSQGIDQIDKLEEFIKRTKENRYVNPVMIDQHKATNSINSIDATAEGKIHSTGLAELDNLLAGGLYNGLYIIGAVTSLGKTTLCLQIADNIAKNGTDVIYIALEMATAQMIRKSLSRHSFMNCKTTTGGALTELEISKGAPNNTESLEKAKADYMKYADHIYYYEGVGDIGINEIRKIVDDHARSTGNRPVLFVDYLQIVAPADVRATDKQNADTVVLGLKRISRDYKIPVVAVSSLNRVNYDAAINMAAFKETGAIEYTSDVLIGLQFKGAGINGFDIAEAKSKSPREIELKVLKNRSYIIGDIELAYYPKYNTFEQLYNPFR